MTDRFAELAAWGQGVTRDASGAFSAVLLHSGEMPASTHRLASESGIDVIPISGGYEAGAQAADRAADSGASIVVVTASASVQASCALIALLTRSNAAQVTADNADDAQWMDTCTAIRDAMMQARPAMGDVRALLTAIDDECLATAAGAIAAASRRGLGVVLDDLASCAAALAVAREDRTLSRGWLAGVGTNEPAQQRALEWLELAPVIDLGAVPVGVGAIAALGVLRSVLNATSETSPTH